VKGTATADSLWVTGAIGAAVGIGSYDVAVILALVTVITLWVMEPLNGLVISLLRSKGSAPQARLTAVNLHSGLI
jgi:uncharacterized membrane protein YhiD involved in acid resistance